MKAPAHPKKPSPPVKPLIPERFAYVFSNRPLLFFEDHKLYDRLLADTLAEFDPKGLVEYNCVKEIVDLQWEILRFRRIKRAAIQAEMPDAAVVHLHGDFERVATSHKISADRPTLKRVVRMASQGHCDCEDILRQLLNAADISSDELLYRTYQSAADSLGMIDARLAKAEQRRDALIQKFEERRRMLAAMEGSQAGKRSRGEVIDVTSPSSNDTDSIKGGANV